MRFTSCASGAGLLGGSFEAGIVLGADSKTDELETLAIGSRERALGHQVLELLEVGLLVALDHTRSGGCCDGRHDRGESHDGGEDSSNEKHVGEEMQ